MPDNEPQIPTETPEQLYARVYPQAPAPQVAPPPQSMVATLPPEVLETINGLRGELTSLKDSVNRGQQVPVDPNKAPAWIEKIRNGEFESATDALVSTIKEKLASQFEEVRTRAQQDAMSASQVNLEIDRHVQSVRQANPELANFERYLQAPVAQRVEEARATGKIKSPTDFVREYKAAIDAEVGELRNLGLVLRGQGKQEAQTRNQQVIASTTLVPNQVQSTQIESTPSIPDDSIEGYFRNRRVDESRRHGMS